MNQGITMRLGLGLFSLIFVAALLLRLPGMDSALAPDETFSYDEYVRTGVERMLFERYQCNNQPLSSLLAWGTSRLWGDADWALRVPALVAGMALFPLLYRLGLVAFGSVPAALLACYLLAIHIYHVAYSANFRSYTLVMLFAAATALQLIRLIERPRWYYLAGIAITSFLMAYSHVVSLLLYAGWGLALLWHGFKAWRRGQLRHRDTVVPIVAGGGGLALGLIAASVAYLPAFNLPAAIVTRLLTGTWPRDAFNFVSGAEQPEFLSLDRYTDVISGMTGWPFWLAAALAVAGCYVYLRRGQTGAGIILLTLVGPAFALLAANLRIEPRYSLAIVPFFVLALGAGTDVSAARLASFARGPAAVAIRLGVLVLLCALPTAMMLPRYFENFPHSAPGFATVLWDHKASMAYFKEHAGPGDVITPSPALDMQFDHCADKYLRQFEMAKAEPAQNVRLWLLCSPGEPDYARHVGYPGILEKVASFSYCDAYTLDIKPQDYHRVALGPVAQAVTGGPDWKLTGIEVKGAAVEDKDDPAGTIWYESRGGRNDAWFQSRAIPVQSGHLAAFRTWIYKGAATDVMAQMVFIDSTGMPWKYRITRQPRPESGASDGWELYFVECLSTAEFVAVQAEVRIRGRMEKGDRVGMRAPEIWVDAPVEP